MGLLIGDARPAFGVTNKAVFDDAVSSLPTPVVQQQGFCSVLVFEGAAPGECLEIKAQGIADLARDDRPRHRMVRSVESP